MVRSNRKKNKERRSRITRSRMRKKISRTKRKHRGGQLDESVKQIVSQNIQNREENLGKMLQVACKNSGKCLALGMYGNIIKKYFNNFEDFNMINNSKLQKIGTPSKNGFIIEVPFENHGYTAYAALKCAYNPDSDNLYYEAVIGRLFINTFTKSFPCFLETYSMYAFNNNKNYNEVKTSTINNNLSGIDIKNKIHPITLNVNDFKLSCSSSQLMCLLIQHFDNFTSLHDNCVKNPVDMRMEIYNLLYQTYYPLCALGKKYTHYDLHLGNIFLYKPFQRNECVLMRYHRNNQVYEFKSEYIVKIIDYGRNYFSTDVFPFNTEHIMENLICNARECNPQCGVNVGYSIIQGTIRDPANFHWIDPIKPNMSHDLRAAFDFKALLKSKNYIESFKYDEKFGTPEDMGGDARNIRNIFNLRDALENIININKQISEAKYSGWNVVASMDIYDDFRDYEFKYL